MQSVFILQTQTVSFLVFFSIQNEITGLRGVSEKTAEIFREFHFHPSFFLESFMTELKFFISFNRLGAYFSAIKRMKFEIWTIEKMKMDKFLEKDEIRSFWYSSFVQIWFGVKIGTGVTENFAKNLLNAILVFLQNEPSNFVNGSIYGCPSSPLETPAYLPHLVGDTLATRTLCMTAKHHAGLHYNLHSMYGIFQALATRNAFTNLEPQKRPFVLSRSSFVGQGQFSAHWTGDVISDWPHLQTSIGDILNFNMFGIPLVGADICGFAGDTNPELCLRWHQVAIIASTSIEQDNLGKNTKNTIWDIFNLSTAFAEINAHSEISAHQKQCFFKGGST